MVQLVRLLPAFLISHHLAVATASPRGKPFGAAVTWTANDHLRQEVGAGDDAWGERNEWKLAELFG